MIEQLEQEYSELIRPDNFINHFGDMNEFREWCYLGTVEDLDCARIEFEKYELYEYCAIIKSVSESMLSN